MTDEIWRLHREGMSLSQIARKLGIDREHARSVVTARWAEDKARAKGRK